VGSVKEFYEIKFSLFVEMIESFSDMTNGNTAMFNRSQGKIVTSLDVAPDTNQSFLELILKGYLCEAIKDTSKQRSGMICVDPCSVVIRKLSAEEAKAHEAKKG
jgi:hypothetical protein